MAQVHVLRTGEGVQFLVIYAFKTAKRHGNSLYILPFITQISIYWRVDMRMFCVPAYCLSAALTAKLWSYFKNDQSKQAAAELDQKWSESMRYVCN